jgi:hypothetical protein
VRLQWDPDHHPNGSPLKRRAIQLGLRNDVSAIVDIGSFSLKLQHTGNHVLMFGANYNK